MKHFVTAVLWVVPIFAVGAPVRAQPAGQHRATYAVRIVGTVQRVRDPQTGASMFAIRDHRSNQLWSIAPADDVDLTALVGREVALEGRGSYRRDVRMPYVDVQSVSLQGDSGGSEFRKVSHEAGIAYEEPRTLPTSIETEDAGPSGGGLEASVLPGPELHPPNSSRLMAPREHAPHEKTAVEPVARPVTFEPVWISVDYLFWWVQGMSVPPLVTTAPQGSSGALGNPDTQVMFGGNQVFDQARPGVRLQFGYWPYHHYNVPGFEFEYLKLADRSIDQAFQSDGNPTLARPFTNTNGVQRSAPVAFTNADNQLSGSITIDAASDFDSAGVRLRYDLRGYVPWRPYWFVSEPCSDSDFRIDLLVGYRYMQLDERLLILDNHTMVEPPPVTTRNVRDLFDTSTEFHGFDIGIAHEVRRHNWSLGFLAKLAFGNNHQSVTIDGSTTETTNNVAQNFSGGLLALQSNIGTYDRDRFTVVPEIGVHAAWFFTKHLRARIGYSFIHWDRVVRPGDQIDLTLNENLIPPAAAAGAARPEFPFRDTGVWLSGLNLSLDYLW